MNWRDYERYEETAFDHLLKKYQWHIATTPRFALIDGVATIAGEITHVIEFKSRNESYTSMKRMGTYLISYDKLINGTKIADMMGVPFILLVYLIKDQTLLGIRVSEGGEFVIDMDVRDTITQKNINGGRVMRSNAFIDINNFHIL